jgi:8-amino-7-oxononanoate synthase
MPTLDSQSAAWLMDAEKARLRRRLRGERAGLVSFADNDYLGLRRDPRVIETGRAALEEGGAGAGASRLVTGDHPWYAPLEAEIARRKGRESALVFGSGYLANTGIIPAVVDEGDVIFADKLVHACILDGAKLSGARLVRFAHNDMAHLEQLLETHRNQYRHALIATDHVFSMDGDVAPLADIVGLAKKYDAWTLADDAHGLGVVSAAVDGIDLWMGTLSKAAGGYGGYVAASRSIIDWLTTKARSFVFSTGLPPATCAAATEALRIMQAEPERAECARAHAARVREALGVVPQPSAIVPVILGSAERALSAAESLEAQGLLAVAIRPPTVPPGTARLRLAFSANHAEADVDRLIAALKGVV